MAERDGQDGDRREGVTRIGIDEVSFAKGQKYLTVVVDHHIELAYGETENMVTWRTEFRSLPAADRHRLRYLQRLYTEEWVRTVRSLRPDLTDDQVRACCRAAIAILQSPTEFHSPLGRQELTPLLRRMAIAALLAEPDDAVASA